MKASKKMKELLNRAIARELQVSVQYMWQHVMWSGLKGFAVKDEFKKIAITEMKHAEQIAERLCYMGDRPTTKPEQIHIGDSLKEMISLDMKDEEGAITLYKEIIALARKEGDEVTAKLFCDILAEEEDHQDFFSSLLEDQ